ncbi:MAG: hypothetical protein HC890_07100 [Chloroflexaceae bacterium]|nr:hypothetical protein [Chloroflexaceae bacterium]
MVNMPLRKITVEGIPYLWQRKSRHSQEASGGAEILTVYWAQGKNSPLRIRFQSNGNWRVGYPQGIIEYRSNHWQNQPPHWLNLNRPAVVAALIQHFRKAGWNPQEIKAPLEIADGLRLLETVDLPWGDGIP